MNKLSIYHLEIDQHKCASCGKCSKACKMDINPVEKINSAECIRCGDCVHVCPENALYLGFRVYNKKEMVQDKKDWQVVNNCQSFKNTAYIN